MAEFTAVTEQEVQTNRSIIYNEVAVSGNCSILHREGSGIVTLRGITNQCRARFKISFGANIAIPDGGTVGEISVAIAISGEPLGASTMIVTPAAVEEYQNVYASAFIDVPKGCCVQVSVDNTSIQEILVQNANLIIERTA